MRRGIARNEVKEKEKGPIGAAVLVSGATRR